MEQKFPYQVRKSKLIGAARVHFDCPSCKASVNFDLDDAGSQQPCPACSLLLSIPGVRERQAQSDAANAAQAAQAAEALKRSVDVAKETAGAIEREREAERRRAEAEQARELAAAEEARRGDMGGRGLARAANLATVAAIFFMPVAIASFVLGGLAFEKSRGKVGGGALQASLAITIVWSLLVLVSILKGH